MKWNSFIHETIPAYKCCIIFIETFTSLPPLSVGWTVVHDLKFNRDRYKKLTEYRHKKKKTTTETWSCGYYRVTLFRCMSQNYQKPFEASIPERRLYKCICLHGLFTQYEQAGDIAYAWAQVMGYLNVPMGLCSQMRDEPLQKYDIGLCYWDPWRDEQCDYIIVSIIQNYEMTVMYLNSCLSVLLEMTFTAVGGGAILTVKSFTQCNSYIL